jgi:uncharacterized protein YceK
MDRGPLSNPTEKGKEARRGRDMIWTMEEDLMMMRKATTMLDLPGSTTL